MEKQVKKEFGIGNKIPIDFNEEIFIVINVNKMDGSIFFSYDSNIQNKKVSKNIISNLTNITNVEKNIDNNPDLIDIKLNDTVIIHYNLKTQEYEIENKLTSFETRLIAQGKTDGIPYDRINKPSFSPKTDLHTHLAGALTADSMIKIGKKYDVLYDAEMLKSMNIDINKYEIKERNGISGISVNDLDEEDIFTLKHNLSINNMLQETFLKMEELYDRRDPFSKPVDFFKDILYELAQDYNKMGVEYVELSFARFFKDPKYLQILEEIDPETNKTILEDIKEKFNVDIKFLIALRRDELEIKNLSLVEQLKELSKSPYIVGVDFMGYETNSAKEIIAPLSKIVEFVMTENPDFEIRIHAGESKTQQENMKITLDTIRKTVNRTRKNQNDPDLPIPDIRLGHGLQGVDDNVIKLLKELNVTIEINMSSNMALNNINTLDDVPLLKYLNEGINIVLGTDGHGMYGTTSRQEALLAYISGVDNKGFELLEQTEEKILQKSKNRSEIGEKSTEIYKKTEEIKERFAPLIEAKEIEIKEKQAKITESIKENCKENNVETSPDEIQKVTKNKTPILIMGPMKLNDPEKSEIIEKSIDLLLENINPENTYIITSNANNGVSKLLAEKVKTYNEEHDTKIVLVGTILNNEQNIDVSPNLDYAYFYENIADYKMFEDIQSNKAKEENGLFVVFGGGAYVCNVMKNCHNSEIKMFVLDGFDDKTVDTLKTMHGNGYSFQEPDYLIKLLYDTKPDNINVGKYVLSSINDKYKNITTTIDSRVNSLE